VVRAELSAIHLPPLVLIMGLHGLTPRRTHLEAARTDHPTLELNPTAPLLLLAGPAGSQDTLTR
jgi:hypothetical protein